MVFRGVIHFHSNYSYDSTFSIPQIVEAVIRHGLNFVLLTDHDTIKGSQALQAEVARRNLDVTVPIAAEYNTEYGDVIAAFIDEEITDMRFGPFVEAVRRQNGLLFLPHPYVRHRNIEDVARACDLIEVFNGFATDENNEKAERLAEQLGKPGYASPDCHLPRNFTDAIITFPRNGDLRHSLLTSQMRWKGGRKARQLDQLQSQLVKAVKTRNPKLFVAKSRIMLASLVRGRLFQRI